MDGHFEGSFTEKHVYHGTEKESINDRGGQSPVTIDILPDTVLLEIFDCILTRIREECADSSFEPMAWHTLVHVCRKWRSVGLGSPHRLKLRLFCTDRTPVREKLAVWPALPIIIRQSSHQTRSMDNIIAALEHTDRVCEFSLLHVNGSQLENVLVAMQEPFPALTVLVLSIYLQRDDDDRRPAPVIPDSFLGGSAPSLQGLIFERTPFPGLPKLLLSATHLTELAPEDIPHSGYFSPEAFVRCLSAMTRLEDLSLGFESPLSHPGRQSRRPPPPQHSALPALIYFRFEGVSEYLEALVARVNAPLLSGLRVIFFHQLIIDTPQLVQFISRTPNLKIPDEARVLFSNRYVRITFPRTSSNSKIGLVHTQGHHMT